MGPNPTTMTLIICSVCSGSRAAHWRHELCVGMCASALTPPMPDNWHWCSIERGGRAPQLQAPAQGQGQPGVPLVITTHSGHRTLQTPVFWAYLPSIQNIITGLLTANFKISGTIIFMCMLKSMGLERSMTRGTLTWWLHILMRMTRVRFLIKRSQCPDVPSQAAMLRVRNQMAGIVPTLDISHVLHHPSE